jgi:ubiquinone/menaquinone biosynthesis C-methylase UbiE
LIRTAHLLLALMAFALLSGCEAQPVTFPDAHRPVAPIVSSRWSTEENRDKEREADRIMDLSGIGSGMTVGDIGAGEGYYTIRLSRRVGKTGRVVAEDIMPNVRDALAMRVLRERLDNVSVKLGTPDNPMLPDNSFDRVLMIHMYHEISTPYAFLWHLRPSLRAGGKVIVVDADRPTKDHGTPPVLLQCEFAALGYKMVEFKEAAFAGGYFAAFQAVGPRPDPSSIKTCRLQGDGK